MVLILFAAAFFCLFFDSVLKDTVDSYITTSESLKAGNAKIISGDAPLSDENILKLFANSEEDSKRVEELINSIRKLIKSLAYLIITIGILQGYTIIRIYRDDNK